MWNFFKKRLVLIIVFLALLAISCQNKNLHNPQIGDYIISNENEFKEFAKQVNKGNSFEGKIVALANDIALTEMWMPIGDVDNPFQGTFDGGGYTISGLTISGLFTDSVSFSGLFGVVGENGQIRNVHVVAKIIKGLAYVGGLAGFYSSSKPIENSSVRADLIIATKDSKLSCSGGLVGCFSIFDSKTKGYAISNSSVIGNIVAVNPDLSLSGGLVGFSDSVISISNSYFKGDVLTFSKNSISGGLVGSIGDTLTISYSYAIGNISALSFDGSFSGGLVGSSLDSDNEYIISISNSYSNSNILAVGGNASFSGGLIGSIADKFVISNSYAGGNSDGIVTYEYVGGISGVINSYGKTSSVYYNKEGSAKAYNINVEGADSLISQMEVFGLLTENLKKQESFKGWDFENIWKIDSEINNGYPYLRWSEKEQTKPGTDTSLGGIGDPFIRGLINEHFSDYLDITIDSTRSKEDIMQVVNDRMPELRNIYNDYLKLKPGFSGKVTLKFTIVPSGEILNIDILSSTTEYPEFDIAIKNMVATWRWKAIYKGNVTPTIPFNFTE